MATIRIQKYHGKRGTTYAVRYKDPLTAQSKHYRSFKRYKDANDARNHLRVLLDNGGLPAKKQKFTLLTLNAVAESLRCEWISRQKRGELSAKTLYEYESRLKALCKTFGNKLLVEISDTEIRTWKS